jgi:hypothetical protein
MEVKISITTDSGEVKEIIREIQIDEQQDLITQLEGAVGSIKTEFNGLVLQSALDEEQTRYSLEKKRDDSA